MRELIRTDGARSYLDGRPSVADVLGLLGAEMLGFETLAHMAEPHVMVVDDTSIDKGLPVNAAATRVYRAAGYPAHWSIRGDAVVLPEADDVNEVTMILLSLSPKYPGLTRARVEAFVAAHGQRRRV